MRNERENALDKKFHALSNQTRREILMQLNQNPTLRERLQDIFR